MLVSLPVPFFNFNFHFLHFFFPIFFNFKSRLHGILGSNQTRMLGLTNLGESSPVSPLIFSRSGVRVRVRVRIRIRVRVRVRVRVRGSGAWLAGLRVER